MLIVRQHCDIFMSGFNKIKLIRYKIAMCFDIPKQTFKINAVICLLGQMEKFKPFTSIDFSSSESS